MQTIKKLTFTLFILVFAFASTADIKARLEIVFCLDLSGSTNGLVDDVRNNLWQLINQAGIEKNTTDIKIGVVGYARPSFGKTSAYVKVISDLTDDYDNVSYQLNQLRASVEKGDQFVPNALYVATLGLHWSERTGAKKIIYLIGNGSVETGRFDFRKACEIASNNHIVINPVYCLQQSGTEKDLPGWNAIATLTGGMFNTIKISDEPRSYSIAGIENDFLSLNKKFSSTFVYYGSDGLKRFKMMNELDTFCMRISPKCFYSRCKIKTTANYLNKYAAWDLVTLFKANPPDFNSLNKKLLPDSLQQMDVPTLNKIVFAKKEEREYIVAQMRNSFSSLKPPQSNTSIVDSIFFEGLKK